MSKNRFSMFSRRMSHRHRLFYQACGVGLAAFVLTIWLVPAYAVGIAGNAFFLCYLGMVARKLPKLTPEFLAKHAREEDAPVGGIFFIAVGVVVVCVVSLFLALNGGDDPDIGEVVISVTSVLLGWFAFHTMAALHYAYEYYEAPEEAAGDTEVAGGLSFPGDEEPNGVAFLYFSYVLGAAVATSDIKVTSNSMRRRVIAHSTFAFFFNTVILAATVNVALTLGGGQ
ncbi:DUF1345 domain-containing protein [Devosia ginsengisoli]|uniref:DUF1345 domain-containing protein n=1 Tax=Devosia ginsengisoli TaxID=400770 RepID=A0A5B8LSF2_9HYPH|nr:DUF1345 domain-containing protein [Devosia ginsengisoli]